MNFTFFTRPVARNWQGTDPRVLHIRQTTSLRREMPMCQSRLAVSVLEENERDAAVRTRKDDVNLQCL